MNTIYEDECTPFSCSDWLIILVKRTLNMNARASHFYSTMNGSAMREIMDELKVGAGVFSP